jgi:hypothetical protein
LDGKLLKTISILKTGYLSVYSFILLVMMWLFMIGAGSACIHSGGESPLCGPGGEGGGIAMVVIGAFLAIPIGAFVAILAD